MKFLVYFAMVVVATMVVLTEARGGLLSFLKGDQVQFPNGCEKYAQSGKYQCSLSSADCRACCHFDLDRKNDLYNDRYFMQESHLDSTSDECLCKFCFKYTEEFNNKPNF
jgi:hypothetical protein